MEKNGPVKVRAVVIEVKEKFFDVIDLSTRTINRVYVDVGFHTVPLTPYLNKCLANFWFRLQKIKCAQVKFQNDQGMCSLMVSWKGDGEIPPVEQIIQIFTIIDVQMAYNKVVNKVTVALLRPTSWFLTTNEIYSWICVFYPIYFLIYVQMNFEWLFVKFVSHSLVIFSLLFSFLINFCFEFFVRWINYFIYF